MIIRRLIMTLPFVLLGWVLTLAVVALVTDAAPGYVVIMPSDGLVAALKPDVSILAVNRFSVTVASEAEGIAAHLYHAGALIVLPAGLPGCLPLPEATS